VTQVEYAHLADRIVVAARTGTDSQVGLWLVDPAGSGVTITRTGTVTAPPGQRP
jgi:alkylation response protein AidB-like acyl-CoA dehydrogenase